MAHDVFISHSSQDKTIADAVCAALENNSIRCWMAPRDVQPGRSFAGEITRAIQRSKVMVLIFSKHSNASEQVLREVQLAANSRLHIVQFRIEDVVLNDDLESYLSSPHWLDALNPPFERHLERLQTSVQALLRLGAEHAPQAISEPVIQASSAGPTETKPPPLIPAFTAPAPVPPTQEPPMASPQPPDMPVASPPGGSAVPAVAGTPRPGLSAKGIRAAWITAGAAAFLLLFALLYSRNPARQSSAITSATPAVVTQPTAVPTAAHTVTPWIAPTPASGGLWIKTTPAGAIATVDGSVSKLTPATFSDLSPGRHRVWLSMQGYETQEKEFEVTGGGVAMPPSITLVPTPHDEFDGVWIASPGKKSDWTSTLTIKGSSATITLEYSQDLPRKSSGWEHFPAPYDKSPTLYYQWSTEAKSVSASETSINILWDDWKFSWEPHDLPYAILTRSSRRAKKVPPGSFDFVTPPSKDWGLVLKGSDLVCGDYVFHRRR